MAMLLAVSGMLAAVPGLSLAYPECGRSTVARDYMMQVKKAVPIKEVPMFGELPFGPSELRLEAIGSDLLVGGGQVGFRLGNLGGPMLHLDWIAESELFRVSVRGKILQSLGIKRRRIATIQEGAVRGLLHRVSATPAYYRADIRFFHKGSDHLLGQYSSYTRVMKPRVDLRVRSETPTVEPGKIAKATLLNLGTVPLVTPSYDYGFIVLKFTGEKWVLAPDNPPRRIPKLMRPWVLPAGMKNRGCLRYLVPNDQPPGPLIFISNAAETEGRTLIARFEVVSNP